MDKIYAPSETEGRIYKKWIDGNCFHADVHSEKPPYTIVIPPPNVTGQLHMGHALDETLQDIIIRFKRMQGFDALWLPGTDHAGIATQIKVEEALRQDGLTRHDLGREKFLEKVWEWKNNYGDRIINQLKKLGSSCDWERERFTMDEGCSKAVKRVFVNLYQKDLIYRGSRIINWCPACTTALSDAEVEHSEKNGNFWHVRYPFKDEPGKYIEIATTRPETMLGDVAVAVAPDDERYKGLVGKTLILPLINREIPLIADEYVDKQFGTGAVKITPAHDPNDYLVGQRHNLPEINVMNKDASINGHGGKYEGLTREQARIAVVKDLEGLGLLIKIEPHQHNVGCCYRCGTVVEPLTSVQWFVKMAPLAKPAIEVVENGKIKFIPDRFSKVYLNWMENIHDWCISRQLWWGHRIPAFYCADCCEMVVSAEDVTVCPKCGGSMSQDEDVLDTWFSSALWPFSTLGWPDKTLDLAKYYPTSTLVTGYDIIFFWVARMIFSGLEQMGEIPFDTVFIHGIVRDSEGRKMSKSLGNGIDPLGVIEEYGADALRFSLATGNSPGNDMRFYMERVENSRNFCNKIWNAARFALQHITDIAPETAPLQVADKWILSRYNELVKQVTHNLENYEIGMATSKLYDFFWDYFCDWYIELVKPRLFDDTNPTRQSAQKTLRFVLENVLKLLHPIMPFITEEVYGYLPNSSGILMCEAFPKYDKELEFAAEQAQLDVVCECIRAIRNARANMNVPPSRRADVYILTDAPQIFDDCAAYFARLASSLTLNVSNDLTIPPNSLSIIVQNHQIFIPMEQLVDIEKECERLQKEKKTLESEIKRAKGKLENQGFLSKAPVHLIDEEKEKLSRYTESLSKVVENISRLQGENA